FHLRPVTYFYLIHTERNDAMKFRKCTEKKSCPYSIGDRLYITYVFTDCYRRCTLDNCPNDEKYARFLLLRKTCESVDFFKITANSRFSVRTMCNQLAWT